MVHRSRLGGLLSVCVCMGLVGGGCAEQDDVARPSSAPVTAAFADLIISNADIHTVDQNTPKAQAMAIIAGKFAAVGSDADMGPWIGPETQVIDAAGKSITPGFVDGHTHLQSGAGLAIGVDLTGLTDPAQWAEQVAAYAAEVPAGTWIVGGAWDHNLTAAKVLPNRNLLDRAAPNHPVALNDIDGHTLWVNGRALAEAGVSADTQAPAGGEIQLDPATGEPTGILLESASRFIEQLPAFQAAYDTADALRAAARKANSLGVTTVHDMSTGIDTFIDLAEDDQFTLRVWQGAVITGEQDENLGKQLRSLAELRDSAQVRLAERTAQQGPLFELGFIKSVIDGVLSTRTALMLAPYSDDASATTEPITPAESLSRIVAAAHEHNFPVALHAIGDGAVAMALDVIGAAQEARPSLPVPNRIEHIEVVEPADIARFKSLNVVASMHPHHVTCCMGNYILERIGAARLPYAYAWRLFLDAEVPLVLGTDWPTATFDPLQQIADTLFREDVVKGNGVTDFDQGMTLSFAEALHSYTQAGADATRWADQIGSITPGKWADFVMLNDAIALPADARFQSLRVQATYWSGRPIYRAPAVANREQSLGNEQTAQQQ